MRRNRFLAYVSTLLTACMAPIVGIKRGRAQSMMNGPHADMSTYMEMFEHHREIRRAVVRLPNGIRTVTDSDNPRIAALLKEHVPLMYGHLANEQEVSCMSKSLPTLFRNASRYQRHVRLTENGVEVTETSSDAEVLAAIRQHADEVTGFVREGMTAMMRMMR